MDTGFDEVGPYRVPGEQVGGLGVRLGEVANSGKAVHENAVATGSGARLLGEDDGAGGVMAVGAVGVHVEGE